MIHERKDLNLKAYSDAPKYNVQAVEKATGLSSRTLRSWERRYRMLAPQRDIRGWRLYSDRDVALIRWLVDQVQQGVAISRAVALLSGMGVEASSSRLAPQFDMLQLRILQAVDWMDEEELTRILSEVMQSAPVERVVLELIQPVLYRMGELWETGRLSVASEHFGTHLLRTALADLFGRGPEPSLPHRVLVGCAPDELHDVGALVLALFLRHTGFQVTYLGASLESESLMADLRRIRPDARCLSATMAPAGDALAELYRGLNGTFAGVRAYGGSAFDNTLSPQEKIPGIFLGTDVRAAIQVLGAALRGVPQAASNPA